VFRTENQKQPNRIMASQTIVILKYNLLLSFAIVSPVPRSSPRAFLAPVGLTNE
jgi:hypothetical protein